MDSQGHVVRSWHSRGGIGVDVESTVFVIDDDAAARESVVALATYKGLRARGFASAEEFLAQYDSAQKGVLVVDYRMPGMSGLDLLHQLNARHSSLPVVMITGYGDVSMAVKAMRAGAVSFLEKPCKEQELWREIVQALEREKTQHALRKQKSDVAARLASLSEGEMVVFRRLLDGQSNKRIALDLDLGLRTIESRRARIMKKMQAESLPDLVRLAILGGFLKAEGSP
jgi:FixJ family two-component response regulator